MPEQTCTNSTNVLLPGFVFIYFFLAILFPLSNILEIFFISINGECSQVFNELHGIPTWGADGPWGAIHFHMMDLWGFPGSC